MHKSLLSPDTESFSTPPTTPSFYDGPPDLPSSLGRKASKPSSLILENGQTGWRPDILIEENSPNQLRKSNGTSVSPTTGRDIQSSTPKGLSANHLDSIRHNHTQKPMESPCFVHSFLDKSGSLTDWVRSKHNGLIGGLDHHAYKAGVYPPQVASPASTTSSFMDSNDEEEYGGNNLTKHLAETAVGVREMSKQLGRTRVRSNIQRVLIITKARDNRLIKLTRDLAVYLMLKKRPGQKRGLIVYVDNQLRKSKRFDAERIRRDHPELFAPFPLRKTSSNVSLSSTSSSATYDSGNEEEGQLRYWTMAMCSQSPHLFDFVVTLGGDGTVLFTSWIFQHIVPPVLPFALGSLGFLTNFDFSDHQAVMDSVIDNGIRVNLRMRFTCTIYRRTITEEKGKGRTAVKKAETGEIIMKGVEKDGWEALEGGWNHPFVSPEGAKLGKDKEIMCFTTRPVETFEVLNELVVDRGPSPYVSLLELFGDEHHMTTVQADGLTVSTPTGSTAYSLSAGGSLVHPEIPALLITPICPHTLSFRPMLLPDTMELRICVPYNSRSTAWASFDGRGRVELKQGDHIKVTASKYPFPTVCAENQSTDWFHAISRTLKWNERERQKSFVVVEEGPSRPKSKRKQSKAVAPHVVPEDEEDEEDEVSDEEGEDGTFDIDSTVEGESTETSTTQKDDRAGRPKAQPIADEQVHPAISASALKSMRRASKSRSRSRSAIRSTSATTGGHKHVEFMSGYSPTSSDSSGNHDHTQDSIRDDLRTARKTSARGKMFKDRDGDVESARTPTLPHASYRSRSRSADFGHRAFAVWGHDESDSNASDSDP